MQSHAHTYLKHLAHARELGIELVSCEPERGFCAMRLPTMTPGNDVLTNANRPMVGQAEYVVNSGLTYAGPSGVSATALYNVVGARILEAGARPFPDSYEQARHIVDVSVQFPVFNNTTFRVDGKNLLDSPYEVIQGGITRVRYKAGRVFSFGASWSP